MDAGGFNPAQDNEARHAAERLKIFVSYSRADIDFADQLVMLLEAKGFDPMIDRHDIDAAEKWKQRLRDLLFSCDTVIFVLTDTSAKSPICAWEVAHAAELGKRMIPILPRPCLAAAVPQLAELNFIHMFRDPNLPGTSFTDGMEKLERALRTDLAWLRMQTRLAERAAEWRRAEAEDRLLRGAALAETEEWLARIPKGAVLDPNVRAYIDASAAAETRRTSEAARQLAEREEALKLAEAAAGEIAKEQGARTKAQRSTRILAIASLVLGVALSIGAGIGFWQAGLAKSQADENAVSAADARSAMFATAAEQLNSEGRHIEAVAMALYGDPAARAADAERRLRPDGFLSTRNALVAGYVANRVERIIANHSSPVLDVGYSPDGSRIVTASWDGTARIWDVATGRELLVLSGPRGQVMSAAFSADGSRVIAAVAYKAVVWDSADGELLFEIDLGNSVSEAVFSWDGSRIVTASLDKTVRVWNADTGAVIGTLPAADFISSVDISLDGSRVVAGLANNTAQVWNVEARKVEFVLRGHSGPVSGVAFSPGETQIATASRDGTARLWDAATGASGNEFKMGSSELKGVAFSPDGSRIATTSADGAVVVWDAYFGRPLMSLSGHTEAATSASFSPDGTRIVTGSFDDTTRIWDVREEGVLTFQGETYRLGNIEFSNNATRAAAGSRKGTVHVWNPVDGTEVATLSGHAQGITSIAFSPDDSTILTASDDATARLWSLATATEIAVFKGHTQRLTEARFSRDGSLIVTASWDGATRIWDAAEHTELQKLDAGSVVRSAEFSPDGRRVLTAHDDGVRVWDVVDGQLLFELAGHSEFVASAMYSPDGARIVTASADKTARLWNAETGAIIALLAEHEGYVVDARFSPDGTRIVTVSLQGPPQLWDGSNGKSLAVLFGHSNLVQSAAFSSDSKWVVTASGDHSARMWDARTGQVLLTLEASFDSVNEAVFSPSGERILTASREGVRSWQVPPLFSASAVDQVATACSMLSAAGFRDLPPQQRARFRILDGVPRHPCVPPAAAALPSDVRLHQMGPDKGAHP